MAIIMLMSKQETRTSAPTQRHAIIVREKIKKQTTMIPIKNNHDKIIHSGGGRERDNHTEFRPPFGRGIYWTDTMRVSAVELLQ